MEPTTATPLNVDLAAQRVLDLVGLVARDLHRGHAALPPPRLDSSLERELALDSLARVELGQRIEREFSRAVPETALFEAETPRDLLRAVLKAQGGAPIKLSVTTLAAGDGAAVALPLQARTLVEMLAWQVEHHGERVHVQFYDDYTAGATITYRELWDGAAALAAGLQAHALEPGARVALMLPTGRDYFLAFYAVVLAGGVPVPIYPPVRRAQIEDHLRRQSRILGNCQAAMLITTADAIVPARLLGAGVTSLRTVATVAELATASGDFECATPAPDALAFLQYTSGSTGDPKGVMLTHANLLANIRADGQCLAVTPADVFVSWLPLYHDMGLIGAWLGSLYHAVRLVIMPPLTFLAHPERWLWAMHRYHGTLSAAPNFAFELCVNRISEADLAGLDLSRWRLALNGAEAISPATLEAFCTRFAPYGFRRETMLPVYGLAECAVGLTFSPLGRGPHCENIERERLANSGRAVLAADATPTAAIRRIVSCGLPLARHEIRIVDDALRELPERMEGRVQFCGPSATCGYYANPVATAQLLQQGWLETGDRGYVAGGELFLTGRSKDIIIRAGRNIYPAELEDAVGALDGVRAGHVAVFGVHDQDAGTERVVVLAETRKRGEAAHARLRDAINLLAADLIAAPPDEIVLAPPNTVLRTSSGKIRRAACRTVYAGGRIGAPAAAVWLQFARLALAAVGPQLRRRCRALLAWLFATLGWASFLLLGLAAWVVTWLPLPSSVTWRAARLLARTLGRVTATPIAAAGLEQLPPAGQAGVLVANHQSYLDGMLMLALLPRPPRFLIKGELRNSALLGRPLARLGAVFVDRFDAAGGVAGLHEARTALAAGELLVIFPEGTFKRMPGVLPFHLGAFTLAVASAAPLLPVAIHGTRSILRGDSRFPRPGRITVRCGPALAAAASDDAWQAAITLRDSARAFILSHCGEPDLADESNRVEGG